ncbi:MAG: 2-amino-4-hydroxy-6-hydroxymethyldihydropteridine diphosphokinase [Pseudomonadota bacterium]
MSRRCYLGLGSNLQDPQRQITRAIEDIGNSPNVAVIAQSSMYGSAPMGPQDQNDYVNAVAEIETDLSALTLLGAVRAVEESFGRDRSVVRWGPRIIDIDILLFGDQELVLRRLKIPHPGLTQRAFVVVPLLEIAPNLRLPDGRLLAEFEGNFPSNAVNKL